MEVKLFNMKKHSKRFLNRFFIFIIIVAFVLLALTILFFYGETKKTSKDEMSCGVDTLISWSNSYYHNDQAKAYAKLDEAKSIAIEKEDSKLIGDVFFKEASFHKSLDFYTKAINSYRTAAKFYEKSSRLRELADAYYNLADIYKIIGDYNKSLDYCKKGLLISETFDDKVSSRRFYRTIGSVYKYLGDFDKSIKYYQKALDLSKKNDSDYAAALNNLGTAYEEMGNDTMALELYKQTYELNVENKDTSGLAIYYNNVGSIYLNNNRLDEALECFRKSLCYRKIAKDKRKEATVLYNLGQYYFQLVQYDSSIYYLSQVVDIASRHGFKERLLGTRLLLSEAYLKSGKAHKAYTEIIEYCKVKDEDYKAQKSLEISRLESSFNDYKDQAQSRSDKQRHKLLMIIFALSVLVFFLIIIGVVKRYRISLQKYKNQSNTLIEEKCRIEENLSEKNRELISYSLQLAQKQESSNLLVERIRGEMRSASSDTRKHLQLILTDILNEQHRVNIWDDFEIRFNQVNQQFYKNLLVSFPQLSQNEKRLCAFLKLNLNTKEISIITGQSPHSINVARTRLRKKLGLSNSNLSLFDFLQNF